MLKIVAGPPFAGKTQYVESEIDKREKAGERGLLLIDFTALYLAMFPARLTRCGCRVAQVFRSRNTCARP